MTRRIPATLAVATAALLAGAACDAGSAGAEPAGSAAQRGPLPPEVVRHLGQWRTEILEDACSGPGFAASGAPSITHTADFNADGQTDYVVGVGELACRMDGEPMFSVFSPFAPGAVILSSSEGYVREDFQYAETGEVELREVDGHPALILSTAGPGAYERPFYAMAWGWTGATLNAVAFYDAEGRRVNEDGSAWRASTKAAPASASGALSRFLPLRIGYYAPNGDCATDPFYLQYLDETGIQHSDGGSPCRYVGARSLGGGRYETTESCPSEEGGEAPLIGVWRVSGDAYVYDAPDTPELRFCPVERVPAASRFKG